ncbi:hypothetical protein FNV43_RR19134 [Rhamnella rubrinervis]|uniref:Uncharacterized protein n=1 Tax=Rhamnella rubrinervis TaxID=2594499 RepID=A0A8K0GWY4_9ROSA|nr:hypothetical protein FNV43_RR19134 [Rhamnella rubrinervis]
MSTVAATFFDNLLTTIVNSATALFDALVCFSLRAAFNICGRFFPEADGDSYLLRALTRLVNLSNASTLCTSSSKSRL